ncbi:hypothetical protein [Roseivivax isoporae]|uniref:Dihydrodipicolinate reductase n=1 Tax=Roseivivax isoporae LMG 25204 TaxID=1449351 RepID=X7F6D4_9RHOB|nr:hypothetical protein [Roseivivax isoporae]ETX28467.1 dihydrodipicolinate reductase [Roseivivax isoporae LMG 25204]
MNGTFLAAAALAAPLSLAAGIAAADFAPVTDRGDFVDLVVGKTLTRPLVSLSVTEDGAISGTGAGWDVTGQWTWQDGYFCRDLNWGGDDLGYNCQLVTADGDRVRFTSDRGSGQSAGFRLD